jgi:membrane protease YdiL (CAAX protease family)
MEGERREPGEVRIAHEIRSQVEPPARPPMPAALRVTLYLVTWLVCWVGAQAAVVIAAGVVMVVGGASLEAVQKQLLTGGLPPLPVLAGINVAALLATLAVTVVFVGVIERRPLRDLGFQLVRGWPLHWVVGFLLDAGHLTVLFLVGLVGGWYSVVHATGPAQAVMILVGAFLLLLPAAAVEEITMRGYVLQRLEERYGTGWAVAVSSLLFACLHLENPGARSPMVMLGLFLAGVHLSVGYLATRQLWLPIAMHTAWNVFEGPVFGVPVSGIEVPYTIVKVSVHGPALLTGGQFGPEAGLPVLATTLVWTAITWFVARRLPGSRLTEASGGGAGAVDVQR